MLSLLDTIDAGQLSTAKAKLVVRQDRMRNLVEADGEQFLYLNNIYETSISWQ